LALVLIALLAGTFPLFLHRSGSRIRHYESLAKARKEPLTLEELARAYARIPGDENAAVLLVNIWRSESPEFWAAYEAGARNLPGNKPEPPIPFPDSKSAAQVPPAGLEPLAGHVAARREHREAIRQALERESFRYPLRITDGFAAIPPYLSRIKREAQEFQAESWIATERGDITTALRAIKDMARVAALQRDDPFLIGQRVRIACNSICLAEAERLLSRRSLAEPQLLELQAVVSTLSAMDGFHRAMIGERASGLAWIRNPNRITAAGPSTESNDPADRSGSASGIFGLRLTVMEQAAQALFLETFEHVLTNAPPDSAARLQVVGKVMGNFGAQAKRFPPKIFSGTELPTLFLDAQRFCQLEAQREAALTALAVERYRLLHAGRMPGALTELVPDLLPEVPRDPFDGQPLRYHQSKEGYVVYSVGPDRIDHGGREKPKKGGTSQFDVTFTVRR
jgi:hypothetical protein